MAFTEIVASTLENKPKVYVCLAADVKTVAGINNGSILYEIDAAGDVKNQYLFFDGAWKPHKKLVEGSMTLSGSIAEYGWIKGKAQPAPIEDIAIGIEFDTVTKAKTSYVWDSDTSTWEVC